MATKEQVAIARSKFKNYKSMKKTHDTKTIKHWRDMGYMNPNVKWNVTEKVHGLNFSTIVDGLTILHAEREEIQEFYKGSDEHKNIGNWQNLAATKRMDNAIFEASKALGNMQVYQELHGEGITGSSYKAKLPKLDEQGNEVERMSNNPVIKYHPIPSHLTTVEELVEHAESLRNYVMFDCMLLDKPYNIGTEESPVYANTYLGLNELQDMSQQYGIPMAPVLFVGTYDECMEYILANPEPKSLLAKNNGVVEEQDSEGYVLKPCETIQYAEGGNIIRVLVKRIAEKFADIKLSPEINKLIKQKIASGDKHEADAKIIETRVNDMRVTNRAAGLGITSVDKNKFGELMLAVANDILKEVETELDIKLDDKQVKNACLPFVKAFFA